PLLYASKLGALFWVPKYPPKRLARNWAEGLVAAYEATPGASPSPPPSRLGSTELATALPPMIAAGTHGMVYPFNGMYALMWYGMDLGPMARRAASWSTIHPPKNA